MIFAMRALWSTTVFFSCIPFSCIPLLKQIEVRSVFIEDWLKFAYVYQFSISDTSGILSTSVLHLDLWERLGN